MGDARSRTPRMKGARLLRPGTLQRTRPCDGPDLHFAREERPCRCRVDEQAEGEHVRRGSDARSQHDDRRRPFRRRHRRLHARIETGWHLVRGRGHQSPRFVHPRLQGDVLPELPGDPEQDGEHTEALHRRDRRPLRWRWPRDRDGDRPARRLRWRVAGRVAGGHPRCLAWNRGHAAPPPARREESSDRPHGDGAHDHPERRPRLGPVQPRVPAGEVLGRDDGLRERARISAAFRPGGWAHQKVRDGRYRDADVRGPRPRAGVAEPPVRDGGRQRRIPRVPRKAGAQVPGQVIPPVGPWKRSPDPRGVLTLFKVDEEARTQGSAWLCPAHPMKFETILVRSQDSLALVTLNRPEKLNAMSMVLKEELIRALRELDADKATRVIVITGAGQKAFTAGADIHEFHGRTPMEQWRMYEHGTLYDAVDRMSKPILAMINGYCFGGGLELAMACDIRIASSRATLGQTELNIGIIPGGGGSQRLSRLVGLGDAMKLTLTGDRIDAAEALRIGLVDEVVPNARLEPRTFEIAGKIAAHSAIAVRLAKAAIRASTRLPLDQGLRYEQTLFALAMASADKEEGVQAFLEKREAQWKDR